jgi:hypothetical protein
MRKFAVITAALALLAGTTAAVSIASASAAPQHAATDSVKVLHLISHDTSVNVLDLGKKGPSPGDQVMESTADFQNGKLVDRSFLNCVRVRVRITARMENVLCHGAMIFTNGQVQLQGETNFHTPFTIAVTGGTGAYQNVGGQLTLLRTLPNGNDVETLRLVFFETG